MLYPIVYFNSAEYYYIFFKLNINLVSNPEEADFINKGVMSSVNRKCPK